MRTSICVIALVALLSGEALARNVFLNGVKLDDNVILKNQSFTACDVKFDDKGDIYITAKGVKVGLEPTSGDGGAPSGKVTKRYWLVAPQAKKGLPQYDVDVYLNGQFVRKVRSGDERVVVEVTKYVKPGDNTVHIVATKVMGDKRVSTSPADMMEVIVGEGQEGGGTVAIDRPVVDYKRTADETKNFADDYSFGAR